jgi:hypothetical protein
MDDSNQKINGLLFKIRYAVTSLQVLVGQAILACRTVLYF